MKRTILTSFVFSTILLFSFSFPKKKKFIPPGTVQITETFYADQTEVSNLSWREYEFWTRQKYGAFSAEYYAVLPDTSVWTRKESFSAPYAKFYYQHTAYKDMPVVGVTHAQVVAFCKWRTARVKEFYMIKYKKEIELEYRLPTVEEWEMLSMSSSTVLSNNGKNKNGEAKLNCVREDTIAWKMNVPYPDVTAPVYSYWPNRFRMYNCIGNVAEMVNEPGICKGGGWKNLPEECRVGKNTPYSKPSAWLGFRCVCELKTCWPHEGNILRID